MNNKYSDLKDKSDVEWKKLSEISNMRTGFTPPTNDESNFGNDYVWFGVVDLSSKYIRKSKRGLSSKVFKERKFIEAGTLLMSFKLSVGKLSFTEVDCFTNEAIVNFEFIKDIDKEYMYYVLDHSDIISYGSQAAQGITLNNESLKVINVPVPSYGKQLKISSLLSSIDNLIEIKKNTKVNLELKKKYYLNEIFGDSKFKLKGEVEYVKLGDICKIGTGNKDLKDSEENGKYNFYVRSKKIQKINEYAYDGEAILLGGDGKIDDLLHFYSGKFNYHQRVYLIISTIFNMKYLFYCMEFGIGKHVMKSSSKTTVDSVRLPFLKDFKVLSLHNVEQIKIGNLLSSIDNLIELSNEEIKELELKKKYYLNEIFS